MRMTDFSVNMQESELISVSSHPKLNRQRTQNRYLNSFLDNDRQEGLDLLMGYMLFRNTQQQQQEEEEPERKGELHAGIDGSRGLTIKKRQDKSAMKNHLYSGHEDAMHHHTKKRKSELRQRNVSLAVEAVMSYDKKKSQINNCIKRSLSQ